MRLLIKTKLKNEESFQERTFLGALLRLGRASDQDIVIEDEAVPLSCCEFSLDAGELRLSVLGKPLVFLNNKKTLGARLRPGDKINAGSCQVTVLEPVDGYDAALAVFTERRGRKTTELQDSLRESLATTGVSKRGLSWLLVAGILLTCLLAPLLVVLEPELREPIRAAVMIPDDGVWDSGPLHNAHRTIGDNCSACHETPFVKVQNNTCVNCHQQITHHASMFRFPDVGLGEARCATCHVEHNNPSVLINKDSRGCTNCHGDVATFAETKTTLAPVSDFEFSHPEFKVSLQVYDQKFAGWNTQRVSLSETNKQDSSQLKFPHDVHLNPEGIEGRDARVVMGCADCHQVEMGGASYEPVRMEKDCSGCHRLTFDTDFPKRQLPHGEANLLVPILEEFYARQTLVSQDLEPGRPTFPAQRPGKVTRMEAALREQALVMAKRKARSTAEMIFEETTCAICHDVTRSTTDTGQPSWTVLPVKLVATWMPKSIFDHKPHADQSCGDCHQAKASAVATDILMPTLASCQSCHGSEHSRNKVISECIDCHRFHNPNQGLMRGREFSSLPTVLNGAKP